MTDAQVIEWAQRVGIFLLGNQPAETTFKTQLVTIARLAYEQGRKDENEACAKVCEQSDEDGEGPDCWDWHAKDYASAIIARMKGERS